MPPAAFLNLSEIITEVTEAFSPGFNLEDNRSCKYVAVIQLTSTSSEAFGPFVVLNPFSSVWLLILAAQEMKQTDNCSP